MPGRREGIVTVDGNRWWKVPALALSGAYGVVGLGLTTELLRTGEESIGDGWLTLVSLLVAVYWVGVGLIVLPLAWFAHRGSRWARIGLAVVAALGGAWAAYWLSYEQYEWEGLVVAGTTVLLCAVASIVAVALLVRERLSR